MIEVKKMRITILVCILALLGCTGFQVTDSSTHKILSYGAGKATAIGINKIRPEVDPNLTSAWVEMMERNEGKEMVASVEMVAFYNHCLLIITGGEFDKYGLINDLSVLLTVFAAEIDPATNQMIFIQPVPYDVLKFFEMGYGNGRQVALSGSK